MESEQWVKYPRTPHAPWSRSLTPDDLRARLSSRLWQPGVEIVATLKMDGEATTIYPSGHTHARSLDSGAHPSRTAVRALAGALGPSIPEGWRVCGENCYAKHSIGYSQLRAHFLIHSVWEGERCLSWDDTLTWAQLWEVPTVETIYRGKMLLEPEWAEVFAPYRDAHEGYVMRVADEFEYSEFAQCVAKYVRPNHVQTDQHWMSQTMVVNGVAHEG